MKILIAALLAASVAAGGSPDTQAQREAVALKKEGDRLQTEGRPQEARERWAKALEAYQRSGHKPGQIEVLFRIGASYQAEAGVEPQKQALFLDAMVRGLLTTAEFIQEVVPRAEPKDRDAVQSGDERFAEAAKLAAAGDCGSAVPLFLEAKALYETGGSPAGQASCQAERLRCLLKAPDPLSFIMAMGEVMTLLETWKPQFQIGPAARHLQAIEAEETGDAARAEALYRGAIKDFEAMGDLAAATRVTQDLEGLLARGGKDRQADTPPAPSEESGGPLPPVEDRGQQTLLTLGSRAQAQREATLLLGEADRLLQASRLREARERWLASAEAFQRAANRQGVATCYRRLGDSYAGEAMFDDRKILLSAEYYGRVMAELAKEAEENRSRSEPGLSETELKEAGSLLEEASGLIDLGDCERAKPLVDKARGLYQKGHLAYGEVLSLMLQGRCHAKKGDLRSAFSTSMEGLSVLTTLSLDTPPSELALRAADLLGAGRWAEAMELYQKVLGRYDEVGDDGGIASTLNEIGWMQLSMGAFAEAEASLFRARSLFSTSAGELDRSDEAAVHHNLGSVYTATGRGAEAVAELRTALSRWRELGELGWEVAALSALGVALNDLGDPAGALAALAEAEKLQSDLSPNPELEGDLLNNRGKVHFSQGRYEEALDLFGKARALYETLPIRFKEAQVVNNIAMTKNALGRFPQALSGFENVKEMARQLGAAHLEMEAETNAASALFESGQYQAAIRSYLQIVSAATDKTEQQVLLTAHNNLGAAYLRLGEPEKAQSHFTQALKAAHRLGNKENEASILSNRGQAYSHAGRSDLAKQDTLEALKIWKDLGNDVVANRVLGNLGWWIESFSEEDLQAFRNGLEFSRKAGQTSDSLRYSLLIGAVLLQRNDFAGALEQAASAIADADRIGDGAGQYVGRTMRLIAHFRQGDSEAALRDLDEAVAGLDRWQSGLTLSELKSSFLAQFSDLYAIGVLLNVHSGRPEQAFSYAEQARARAFLDQIGNQRIPVRRGIDPELARQEGELRVQLAHLGRSIRSERPGSERHNSLLAAWNDAQSDYATLLARLKLADPEYANLVSVNPLNVAEVQQLLDADTTLIEYFVVATQGRQGADSTPVLAWVVDRDRVTMVQLPVSVADLNPLVQEFRNLIESGRPVESLAAELYGGLFAPLAAHVRRQNLVIVPHGVLHFLPFAALWDGKGYLGDAYALSYSPSATALKLAREKNAAAVGPILVVGNPDGSLKYAAAEAESVARRYGAQPLLGPAATEGAVMARAGQAGILHLATHAVLNPYNPLFTRIALAPGEGHDGFLEMHEVFGLDLSRTGLVVLSACSTQLGKLTAGDEIEGLTRAFLYAGTPAVMSSLWDVQDDSTSFLMERFYTHLRQGSGRAEALRRAQLKTRRRHPHPYHWAAFVLTGDGR